MITVASILKNHGSVLAWLSLQHHGLGWHYQYYKEKQQNLAKVQINYQKEHKNTKNIKTGHKPTVHKQQMWWIIPDREGGVAQSCCCRTCSDKRGNQTTCLLTWRTGKSQSKTRQKHTRKDLLSQMTDWLQWKSACVVLDGNKKTSGLFQQDVGEAPPHRVALLARICWMLVLE